MAEVIDTETVNVEHSSFFTAQKDNWWDPNSPFKVLQQIDSRALEYIKDILRKKNFVGNEEGFKFREGVCILDAGCGGGILTEPLARGGSNIIGIDINKSAIETAQAHAKLDPGLKNLRYRWESIEDHALNNPEKYDVVILNLVLHFARNQELLLQNLLKMLKPGGTIFISAIGKSYESWIRIILFGEIIFRHFIRGQFVWEQFINFSDVGTILDKGGCVVEDVKGIYYDVFSSSFQWTNNKNGIYIMHAERRKNK